VPGDAVELECLHRGRASAEDRIRAAKQTGLVNLPFRDFDRNQVRLELSLIAQDLIAWTQHLALNGDLAVCEPKTLRYRLLHTAARVAFHARRATLRLPSHLALGPRPRRRVRAPRGAPTARTLTRGRTLEDHHRPRLTGHNHRCPARAQSPPGHGRENHPRCPSHRNSRTHTTINPTHRPHRPPAASLVNDPG
jgi:hypothetical protein